jgi:hypothetical protein
MRICVLALAAAAALATAAPAFAQLATAACVPNGMGSSSSNNASGSSPLSKTYLKKLTALSYKILEVRTEDGGKLAADHLASLQHELNRLNLQYDVRSSLRVRAA